MIRHSGQPVSRQFHGLCHAARRTTCRSFDLTFAGTRCTTNPLGVKGCGEAGAMALFPAIGNAIADAVGVATLDGPATGSRVWQAMRRIPGGAGPPGSVSRG